MAAAALSAPELALTDSEARTLAIAVAQVNAHYSLPGVSPGQAALLGLGYALVTVYGSKARAISKRKRAARSDAGGNGHGLPNPFEGAAGFGAHMEPASGSGSVMGVPNPAPVNMTGFNFPPLN